MTCTHAPTASCWLCTWERPYGAPFWEDARVRAGLGHAPPNAATTWPWRQHRAQSQQLEATERANNSHLFSGLSAGSGR